ncbi:MAG: c-type cytochrome biogenesis protein CcsB [Flavobacteriaceae bacterium]|jgi:cytochrome c-type biogenesis protein CcsB|nr:c-type cytochrome biogenesis protein CcsB [Flavobacteriaceae bacterium]
MKTFSRILFSTKTTAILLLIFAAAMAVATFVENDYGTSTTKALIYNAKWFELVMFLLILNFIGNIKKYRLWKFEKLPVLLFHLSFILLFVGGAITRYLSYEGQMHIRQSEKSNEVISDATFFKVHIMDDKNHVRAFDTPFIMIPENLSWFLKPFRQEFTGRYQFQDKQLKLETTGFIPHAQDSLRETTDGKQIMEIVALGNNGRENVYIKEGEAKTVGNAVVAFNVNVPGAINIVIQGETALILSPLAGQRMIMQTQQQEPVEAEKAQTLHLASLYRFPNVNFVIPSAPKQGEIIYYEGKKNSNAPDLIFMKAASGNETQEFSFYGQKGITDYQKQILINGMVVSVGYGSKIYHTEPFYLQLDKFVLERYPGSQSPSSYESEVSIIDGGKITPYKIYMNHILNYKGFRFFQSGFDPDLQGTILSVSRDFWGTTVTYTGYALMFLGMLISFFWKGTHFWKLNEQLKKIAENKKFYSLVFAMFSLFTFSQEIDRHGTEDGTVKGETHVHADGTVHSSEENAGEDTTANPHKQIQSDNNAPVIPSQPLEPETFANSVKINKKHADKFGALLVQNFDGRIEPTNTLALEILRKLYKSDNFYNLDANQFLLSISTDPMSWAQVPFIKIGSKGGDELLQKTRANSKGYTTLMNLFQPDAEGIPTFVLKDDFKTAFAKKPAEQNNYDKQVIELNDKLQVLQGLISGQYLRFIPIQNDAANTWTSWLTPEFKTDNTASKIIGAYFSAVIQAEKEGNWANADAQLKNMQDYQYKWGKQVFPPVAKINWEIRYNNWNIFFWLMIIYAVLGMILLVLAFTNLFNSKSKIISFAEKIFLSITLIACLMQVVGLALRWYISGHEPWSNGYEAVMFISWVSVLAGFLLYRNRNGFIPAAGVLVAVILMGFAHGGDQMNPQITPLVPVLKSYWLMVHVAVITSSYGFFGLSALIGAVVLILFIISNKKISHKVENSVRELTIVNEISLTIGIVMLTIGTFLGGMWANESWGRYWSWDPKETWAFIAVIVYAVALHLRLVPNWRGRYVFNLLSLLAFGVVIMTYFGVNYYLSGLHSYAQGDPVPVPFWVYVVIFLVGALGLAAYFAYNRKFAKRK